MNKINTLQKNSHQLEAFISAIDINCYQLLVARPINITKEQYQIDRGHYLANILNEKLSFVIYYKERDDMSCNNLSKQISQMNIQDFNALFQSQEAFYLKTTTINFDNIENTLTLASQVINYFQMVLNKDDKNTEENYISIYDDAIDWIKYVTL